MIRKYYSILLSEGPKSALPWQSKYFLHLHNICYNMTYICKGYIWIYVEVFTTSRKNAKMTKFYEYVGKIREGMWRVGGCTLLSYASLVDFQGFRGEKIGWWQIFVTLLLPRQGTYLGFQYCGCWVLIRFLSRIHNFFLQY